jgi:hypothetical protein
VVHRKMSHKYNKSFTLLTTAPGTMHPPDGGRPDVCSKSARSIVSAGGQMYIAGARLARKSKRNPMLLAIDVFSCGLKVRRIPG